MSSIFRKIRIQCEELIIHKNDPKFIVQIVFTIFNRRGIPFPSSVYNYFNKIEVFTDDMGDEAFLLDFIFPEPNTCLVDIGASVGGWTFIVAKKGFEVYSYEPSPKAYQILKKRAAIYSNVHTYPFALGEKEEFGRLGFTAFGISGKMDEEVQKPGGRTIDITVHKLDSLPLPKVGVIKIDTEGYEIPILLGAQETIQKFKPTLIIEVHKGTGKAAQTFTDELKNVLQLLKKLGYTWSIHYRTSGLHDKQPHIIAMHMV